MMDRGNKCAHITLTCTMNDYVRDTAQLRDTSDRSLVFSSQYGTAGCPAVAAGLAD